MRDSFIDANEQEHHSYIAERDRLEARFLEEMAACPPIANEEARDAASRVVTSCWREALAFENRWYERTLS